jgi:putative hydrolase
MMKMNSGVFKRSIDKMLNRKMVGRCDMHTHTFLSDGVLLPMEMIRRAEVSGHSVIGLTDHVSYSNYEYVIQALIRDCEVACKEMGILALPGAELTHVPPKRIPELARLCREAGALIIVVHGETISEPVPPGTNKAACNCKDVDILAHPGRITSAECRAAKKNGVMLEITSRRGHSLTNGEVFKTGSSVGCEFLVNSDAHTPSDLIDLDMAGAVAKGAVIGQNDVKKALQKAPLTLLRTVKKRLC